MVHFPWGNESEDGDRVSFPRWGKRNVVSHHFTELILEITELDLQRCGFSFFDLQQPQFQCGWPLSRI